MGLHGAVKNQARPYSINKKCLLRSLLFVQTRTCYSENFTLLPCKINYLVNGRSANASYSVMYMSTRKRESLIMVLKCAPLVDTSMSFFFFRDNLCCVGLNFERIAHVKVKQ